MIINFYFYKFFIFMQDQKKVNNMDNVLVNNKLNTSSYKWNKEMINC